MDFLNNDLLTVLILLPVIGAVVLLAYNALAKQESNLKWLTLGFTLFTIWRLYRRRVGMAPESREDFLADPQTSPEIYAWLPYHKEAAGPKLSDEPQLVDEPNVPGISVADPARTAVDEALPPTA